MLDSLLGLCPSAEMRPMNKVLEDGNNRELAPAMLAVRIRASMGMAQPLLYLLETLLSFTLPWINPTVP